MTAASTEATPGGIEFHSIDYIPETERHGNVTNQATLWFLAKR